jgi:hypothetical protein
MRLPADRFEKSGTSGEFLLELKSESRLSQRLIGGHSPPAGDFSDLFSFFS